MKKITTLIMAVFLFFSGTVSASSIIVSLSGKITNFGSDPTGEAAAAGLGLFSPVSYTVLFDFDGEAYSWLSNGTITTYTDYTDSFYGTNYDVDYFYATPINQSHDPLSINKYTSNNGDYYEYYKGSDITGTSISTGNIGYTGEVQVGNHLSLQHQHKLVSDWMVGDELYGYYHYGDQSLNADATMVSNLTVTSITSVPVPAAVWLFGSGLLGLIGVARRKKAA